MKIHDKSTVFVLWSYLHLYNVYIHLYNCSWEMTFLKTWPLNKCFYVTLLNDENIIMSYLFFIALDVKMITEVWVGYLQNLGFMIKIKIWLLVQFTKFRIIRFFSSHPQISGHRLYRFVKIWFRWFIFEILGSK